MIRLDLTELLGSHYEFLDGEHSIAAIYTPFVYQDGDSVPVFVEETGGRLRFFDNGLALWHLISLGVPLDEPGQDKFVEDIAHACGVSFNDRGELELFFEPRQLHDAFTRFMSTLLSIVRWEYEYLSSPGHERPQGFEASPLTAEIIA